MGNIGVNCNQLVVSSHLLQKQFPINAVILYGMVAGILKSSYSVAIAFDQTFIIWWIGDNCKF